MHKNLLALYGLKYNPFSAQVPEEALYQSAKLEQFCWRIENVLLREGGFALVNGEPGTGKSVALRLIANRLKNIRDVRTGVITYPTARLTDFYRELGDVFGVAFNYSNRWHGFKSLRERWAAHLQSTLLRPVLFIDEAQEMPIALLNELRVLTSLDFDSNVLLSVVLAGDHRLNEQLRRDELVPLGSRIKMRFTTEAIGPEQMQECLSHVLVRAGNPGLMTPELMQTLCEHAFGNYRALFNMAAELLAVAAKQELTQLDEKLYLECFTHLAPRNKKPK